jgi:choline-sulfatase
MRTQRAIVLATMCFASCGREAPPPSPSTRTSILLVTLDTTRADAMGPDARGVETPAFNALAARGRRFTQAYATAPETLPSHASMMTGLYPAGHGVHQNARFLSDTHPLIAERLERAGYRTGAFVSSVVLTRRFGLARGFEHYDDTFPPGHAERNSKETTDKAIEYLSKPSNKPSFLWVHYFDPHAPYAPPPSFAERYRGRPYLGEVAAMDADLGRLVQAFDRQTGSRAILVVGDHGEGLGDHGELQHGTLLYQSTMRVPLVIVANGIAPSVENTPVSIRRVFTTLLDVAGIASSESLRTPPRDVVLAEAMKPYLNYGWQPQIMAVEGTRKAIFAGKTEVYDLAADPDEARNLGSGANLSAQMRKSLDDYPVPSIDASRPPDTLSEEARRSLASLGYVSASAAPIVRKNAPRPADMVRLFDTLERAGTLFVEGRYAEALPFFRTILDVDPHNLDAALRLATSYSMLGQNAQALAAFKKAADIAPRSPDVRVYLALHYARGNDWQQAVPMLEKIVAEMPEKLPALEALATIRKRQGRLNEAVELRRKAHGLKTPTAAEWLDLGDTAIRAGQTSVAIEAFERARQLQGAAFKNDLELGVLYLDARRLIEARDALDRVQPSQPVYPMALFKRAQVSVLLREPDSAERIARARQHANPLTRGLIERERLFRGR